MGFFVKEYVEGCHTNQDGENIFSVIAPLLKNGQTVTLSFKDIYSVSYSFLNSALVPLLDDISFDNLKKLLKIVDSNKFINQLIISRLNQEAAEIN
ncbi:hypothetical protein GCM10008018_00980 [Paenibacillus marchantiophytorum]|uniref:DUF4325 domain-containing protein n=1 Tax=Paenibacillus marchantiophytorum TaxID=1619310 RepID=A0ABQ2BMK6_9BACL|nr:STAS-like domain-containing protein [Paenibacillus marchantiophytorum]GGI43222.1 hypothetical protein GCM10008018_00980 [Paenibacillus marchantiophytorum]